MSSSILFIITIIQHVVISFNIQKPSCNQYNPVCLFLTIGSSSHNHDIAWGKRHAVKLTPQEALKRVNINNQNFYDCILILNENETLLKLDSHSNENVLYDIQSDLTEEDIEEIVTPAYLKKASLIAVVTHNGNVFPPLIILPGKKQDPRHHLQLPTEYFLQQILILDMGYL